MERSSISWLGDARFPATRWPPVRSRRAGWPAALPARPGALGGHPQGASGPLAPALRVACPREGASGGVAVGLGAEIRLGAIWCPPGGRRTSGLRRAKEPSPPFDASLLLRSRFGPPAASAQPPYPPCAAMVGIGGCCEGTFCRLDAALPSLCQQIPIGAVRLGPCHPRCLSASATCLRNSSTRSMSALRPR